MGQPKQHLQIAGRSFLEHILLTTSGLMETRVFIGQPEDELSRQTLHRHGGMFVENHRVDLGPLHSIHLGLSHLPVDSGFLLWPVDHPLVRRTTVEALIAAAAAAPESLIIPSDGSRRGHPACFPPWSRNELLAAPLDEGARWVVRRNSERIIHLTVDDIWILRNLNTPERLAEAISRKDRF
jgi:CTP:molybdopterin cytidylyltransferase MocA